MTSRLAFSLLFVLILIPRALCAQSPVSTSTVADAFVMQSAPAKLAFATVDATEAGGFRSGAEQIVPGVVRDLFSSGVLRTGIIATQSATLPGGWVPTVSGTGAAPYVTSADTLSVAKGSAGLVDAGDTVELTAFGGATPGMQVLGTAAPGASVIGKVIRLPGGVQSAGTLAHYLATYGANATYLLPPSYSETVTSTIALSQNNVKIQCGAGAMLLNGTSGKTAPIIMITGTNDTIGAGCKFNNQNIFIRSGFEYAPITLVGSTNTILNGVNVINCGTAYASSPCITAVNINGAQFDQMNLSGPYGLSVIALGNATSQNFEIVGGTMGTLGIVILGPNGTIKNYRVGGTNLNAIGGDAVCGSIGVYSGPAQTGSILNGSVTGTTCTISGTSSATVKNVAISGSGSTGTITLTLSDSTPFWLMENVTMSGFSRFTCLNSKDLLVTSTLGSKVSFSTQGTTCSTGAGSDSGKALAAAFGGWSNPSAGQDGFTFSGNTVKFAEGTSQYIGYAGYEMGCTNCTANNNVFNMPDAYGQTYGCIASYSSSALIEGNQCNGFGANAVGISLAGGISFILPNSDHVRLRNNTVINMAANSSDTRSKGMGYGCHAAGSSARYGEISGNHIYGPFNRAFEIGDSSSGGCTVEFTAHDNDIHNATMGFSVYKATGIISNSSYSGVKTRTSLSFFVDKTLVHTPPKVSAPGTTGVTQTTGDYPK